MFFKFIKHCILFLILIMEVVRSEKYTLGRVRNKYLIIEIFAFSAFLYEAIKLMHGGSRNLREIILHNA
jgi:hypothetical protein